MFLQMLSEEYNDNVADGIYSPDSYIIASGVMVYRS